jgi:predicted phosphodiesterase
MERIMDLVAKEKADAVIFLGDLVGVNEKNIKDRQFLMRTQNFFKVLNQVTKDNVYSVKGNHDIGDFTDFDFLEGLGYIKNPEYLNYYGRKPGATKDDGLEIRFHLVNYGDEHKTLNLTEDTNICTNIVLGHSDFFIEGVTNWYSAGNGVELALLNNFKGVPFVFSGHIHIPSDEILYTNLRDGSSIGLFYLGSPSRVADRYDDCWYLTFEYSKSDDGEYSTAYDTKFMGLEPADKVFFPKEEFIDDDSEEADRANESAKLTDIVKEIMDSRIMSGDLNHQIDIIPGVRPEVKAIAKDYLEKASNIGGSLK